MSEYTPITEEMRERSIQHAMTSRGWPGGWVGETIIREAGEAFDRWLAAHDAQVLRDAAARYVSRYTEPYQVPTTLAFLESEAARIGGRGE